MENSDRLKKDIAKKQKEIDTLVKEMEEISSKLKALQGKLDLENRYLDGLKDSFKYFDDKGVIPPNPSHHIIMREGSELSKVRDLLKGQRHPLHLDTIMALLGFDENKSKQEIKNKKVSLSGSLSSYVRKQAIFTKPKPNTFGLIKTDEDGGEKIKEDQLNEKINENSF